MKTKYVKDQLLSVKINNINFRSVVVEYQCQAYEIEVYVLILYSS